MDDALLIRRLFAGLASFNRLLGTHIPGARVLEGDGWIGSHVPAARNASLLNSVVGLDPRRLTESLSEIEALYGPEQKWGVWCDRRDGRTEGFLEVAGLVLDSRPIGQGAVLADLSGLDQSRAERIPLRVLGAVNEAAYGFDDGRFSTLLVALPDRELSAFGVRGPDGDVASVAAYTPHDGDAHAVFVATRPEARRRGLATEALRGALRHAREHGLETTTLEASPLGSGVYRAMGYRDLCPMALWEKRPG